MGSLSQREFAGDSIDTYEIYNGKDICAIIDSEKGNLLFYSDSNFQNHRVRERIVEEIQEVIDDAYTEQQLRRGGPKHEHPFVSIISSARTEAGDPCAFDAVARDALQKVRGRHYIPTKVAGNFGFNQEGVYLCPETAEEELKQAKLICAWKEGTGIAAAL